MRHTACDPLRGSAIRWILLFCLGVAPSATAGIFELSGVELSPSLPTSIDALEATVGIVYSDCYVGHEVRRDGSTVQVILGRRCNVDPAIPGPWTVRAELPPLEPGEYTLEIIESDHGEDTELLHTDLLQEVPFRVYSTGNYQLGIPEDPPLDDSPFTLGVRWYGDVCGGVESTEVKGDILRIDLDIGCAFTPPITGVGSLEVKVGPLPAGDYEVHLMNGSLASRDELTVYRADGCLPSDTTLCLNRDRFEVRATWRDFEGGEGTAAAVSAASRDDTGFFWFFNEDNLELTAKVLNGCGVNGHYWVFVSPGSTVDWELSVTDTLQGTTRVYQNGLGEVPSLIAQTNAFATCP